MTLLQAYRVLAIIVGVLLAFCALVSLPLKYLATDGTGLQQFGASSAIMWALHGWVFIIYVAVAFVLARRAGWSVAFTLLVLVAGLVPLLIFFVERMVVARLREDLPLDPAPST